MGQQRFAPKLFYQFSLDALVPETHLLRRVAEGVDFSFIRQLSRPYYSHTGQPSVDPVVLFKMLLVGYLYGITSERRLAREVSLHLAYRWFWVTTLTWRRPTTASCPRHAPAWAVPSLRSSFVSRLSSAGRPALWKKDRSMWTARSSGRARLWIL